jgi:8-oxo-dGTP pyrophosphatase MutT (NUDIX family)
VEKGETSGEAAAREAHEEGELTSFRQADNTAGIPAQIPEDDISPELCTIESAKPGVEVWHVHAIAIDSEKDLDKDW